MKLQMQIFLKVHDDPSNVPVDGPTQWVSNAVYFQAHVFWKFIPVLGCLNIVFLFHIFLHHIVTFLFHCKL